MIVIRQVALLCVLVLVLESQLATTPCALLEHICGLCFHCLDNETAIWCQADCDVEAHQMCVAEDFHFRSTHSRCAYASAKIKHMQTITYIALALNIKTYTGYQNQYKNVPIYSVQLAVIVYKPTV